MTSPDQRPEPPPLTDEHVPYLNGHDAADTADFAQAEREALKPPMFVTTDTHNAERFAAAFGRDLRYCRAWKSWLSWDGKRWARDATGDAERAAKAVARAIAQEALSEENPAQRGQLLQWAIKSEDAKRRGAMLTLAQTEPGIGVTHSSLDANPWLLNCDNGILDLRTGTLAPHTRDALITKLAPCDYDPDADAPTWRAFLERIMDGNEGLLRFLRALAGYILTGDVAGECAFFLVGRGSNGKSTFIHTLQNVLGDYARSVPNELIMSDERKGGASPERAMLRGLRMAVCSETEENRTMSAAALKQVTSTDIITARELYEAQTDFPPTHKLVICTNHKPRVRSADEGTWRRIILVPFTVSIPESQKDYGLMEKLRLERSGILAWMVRGCLDWQRNGAGKRGLQMPSEVSDATREYRESEDTLLPFMTECVIVSHDESVTRSDLRKSYQSWCDGRKEHAMSPQLFASRVSEMSGVTDKKVAGERIWHGIRLRNMYDVRAGADGAENKTFS